MKSGQLNFLKISYFPVILILTIMVPVVVTAGSISGNVVDSQTQQPISGLSVLVSNHTSGALVNSASTNVDGDYTVSGLSTESYKIYINALGTGYASEYYENSYESISAAPVVVTQGETTAGIDFSLESSGTLSGMVISTASEQPIENLAVHAYDYSSGLFGNSAITDVNGQYTITELAPGTYRVWIGGAESNYANEFYDGTSDYSSALAVVVTQGQETSGIDFSAEPGATISGVVTDSVSAQNIEDIRICANHSSNSYSVSCTDTSTNGAYLLTGIAAGSYRISTWDSTGTYTREYYDGSYSSSSANIIEVTQGQTQTNINFGLEQTGSIPLVLDVGQTITGANFSLELGGSISGTVTGSDGQNLTDVWVTAFADRCWNNKLAYDKTDENGNFTIAAVPSGKFYLFADATHELPRNYKNEFWNGNSGTTDCNAAMPLTAIIGQDLPNTDFILDHSFSVDLVVKRVQKSNSNIITSVEIMIGDSFNGTLPDDIAAITLTGPSGVLSSEKTDFTY